MHKYTHSKASEKPTIRSDKHFIKKCPYVLKRCKNAKLTIFGNFLENLNLEGYRGIF
jgi:hypothetical protein